MKSPRIHARAHEGGFTLLLAALVASIVLAIGAAIYGIAIKELDLSSVGRDSQFAFYAADTAAECTLYNDINKQIFSTTTPPAQVTCDGVPSTVSATQLQSVVSGGSQDYTAAGTYTFTTPSQYSTLTVTVNGGGGGGGGGARVGGITNGSPGTNGQNSTFNAVSGTVTGERGGGGDGGKYSGAAAANGTTGSGSGGTVISGGGATGGTGGNGTGVAPSSGNGGNGGNGGQTTTIYNSSSILGTNTNITVVVGGGGTGGLPGGGGAAQPGNAGNPGSVLITWVGGTPVWSGTVFYFQSEPNGVCAITSLTKTRVSGSLHNLIHSDGSNVPCAATTTSPRALQRSVELMY